MRDAPADGLVDGLKTIPILLGDAGVRRAYWLSVLVLLPGCTLVLAACCGAPALALLALVPHGALVVRGTADASLADFSESWAFYDHTQYYTCAAMAVVAGQALLAKGG